MSYGSIARCAQDFALRNRVAGCYAKDGHSGPEQIAADVMWIVSADPTIEAAYAQALAEENPNPGGDESVVTDAMLYAAIEAIPASP